MIDLPEEKESLRSSPLIGCPCTLKSAKKKKTKIFRRKSKQLGVCRTGQGDFLLHTLLQQLLHIRVDYAPPSLSFSLHVISLSLLSFPSFFPLFLISLAPSRVSFLYHPSAIAPLRFFSVCRDNNSTNIVVPVSAVHNNAAYLRTCFLLVWREGITCQGVAVTLLVRLFLEKLRCLHRRQANILGSQGVDPLGVHAEGEAGKVVRRVGVGDRRIEGLKFSIDVPI